jgi:hypothetical protein
MERFKTRIVLSLMLAGTAALRGQEAKAPQSDVDVAPPPSDRFPAAWYTTQEGGTETPVAGAPFTGTLLITTAVEPPYQSRIVTYKMRDGAGRFRSEEFAVEVAGSPNPELAQIPHQIDVVDVVAHCEFHWAEPATEEADKVATVSCRSRRVRLHDDGMTSKMTRQTPEVSHNRYATLETTSEIEPLGEGTIQGFRVLGVRQTDTDQDGKGTHQRKMDIWWSPELKEILLTKSLGKGQVPVFELKDIKLGEPDPALFYPPKGWKIRREADVPPLPVPNSIQ